MKTMMCDSDTPPVNSSGDTEFPNSVDGTQHVDSELRETRQQTAQPRDIGKEIWEVLEMQKKNMESHSYDLLVGVICVLTDLLSKITVEWYAGSFMCKLLQYMQAAVTYVSTYVLVSLSLDRYDAVARPMNFSRSPYQARVLITLSWVSALLFAAPSLFLYRLESREGKMQCWIDFPEFWHWKGDKT
ncbi:hypothetical protein ACOMHN_056864 [Nucella lapillus]